MYTYMLLTVLTKSLLNATTGTYSYFLFLQYNPLWHFVHPPWNVDVSGVHWHTHVPLSYTIHVEYFWPRRPGLSARITQNWFSQWFSFITSIWEYMVAGDDFHKIHSRFYPGLVFWGVQVRKHSAEHTITHLKWSWKVRFSAHLNLVN